VRGPPPISGAGYDGGHGAADDVHSGGAPGPAPRGRVFAGDQRPPASQDQVGARPDPEIRAANVRVSFAQIVRREPCLFDFWMEAIPGQDRPEDHVRALVGLLDHAGEPVWWNV
jgi:hypothetical protein